MVNEFFQILSVIALVFLGIVVYKRNTRSLTHIYFFLISLSLALWSFAIAAQSFFPGTYFFVNLAFVGPFAFPGLFVLFSFYFPKKEEQVKKIYINTVIFLTVGFTMLSPFSVVHVNGVRYDTFVSTKIFPIYFLSLIIWGFTILIRKYRKYDGLQKRQVQYFFVGLLFTTSIGGVTNLIFPVVLRDTSLTAIGPVSTLIFFGFVSYAITKYRMLDIRSLVSRSLIYAILVVFVTGSFVAVTYLGSIYLSNRSQSLEYVFLAVASFFIVVLLDPLKRYLAKATNKIFFKAAVDYPKATRAITRVINDEVELDKLVVHLARELQDQLRIKHISIMLPVGDGMYMDPQTGTVTSSKSSRKKGSINSAPLIKYLQKNQSKIVMLDELDRLVADSREEKDRKKYDKLRKVVEKMEVYAAIPVSSAQKTKELAAIILMTRKRSGDGLTVQDIQLFEVLTPQIASAIQKALLYQEAQEFNQKLAREVERQTKELRSANEKLTELDQAKSEFMSIASHQLRTPLAGINGYLSMMEDGDFGRLTKQQQPIIHDVAQATQRLIRMVNVFLNVTRIEAGRFVMNYTKQPFGEVMMDIYKTLKPTADAKGVKLTIDEKGVNKLPTIDVDMDKIKDVIINLTDNAIKYSPDGHVHMSAEANSRTVHVMIKDSGVGIPKEEVDNLFDKFVRGSGIARVEPNGSGLGLFIARKIVEGHGGKIWAASEGEGKGATFQFKIPIKADKEAKKKTEEFKKRAKK